MHEKLTLPEGGGVEHGFNLYIKKRVFDILSYEVHRVHPCWLKKSAPKDNANL